MQRNTKRWLFFASVMIYYTLHEVVYGLMYYQFFLANAILNILLTTGMFAMVALMHRPMRRYLEKRIDWSENPVRRFALQSFLFAGVSSLVIVGFRMLFVYVQIQISANVFVSLQSILIDFIILVVVIELGVLLEFGQYLLQKWNAARIEAADFQKEKAQFNLELLRTQINPHFLFNNLNTLSSLIYTNQDNAAEFLRKLSGVYRSILEYRDKELITVREELRFFTEYKELLEVRFENMLFFEMSIEEKAMDKKIIPLTLQLLVENAIKHNIVSMNKPLTIHLFSDAQYLMVENNLQLKEEAGYSSGLGLKMIETRIESYTSLPVVIDKTLAHFLVKIPFID